MGKDTPAHVLVADDEPVGLAYLLDALRELGCRADGAANGTQALAACATTVYDLLLLDRRMPDLGGAILLRELRRRGCHAVAIATSAELDAAMRAKLVQAGYADAAAKPIGIERLAALLARHVAPRERTHVSFATSPRAAPPAPISPSPLLEDGPALAGVGGDGQTLQTLRRLFARELETMSSRIADMPAHELGEWLHRLRASCRYCGATRLGDSVERLESLRPSLTAPPADERTAFFDLCRQTLAALPKPDSD